MTADCLPLLITDKKDLIYPAQFDKLNGQKGFVFAPYRISNRNPLVLLKPGIYKSGIEEILDININEIPDETELLNNQEDHRPYRVVLLI